MSKTDYNDGRWHGWNGGKCPVHPNSEVEVLTPEFGVSQIYAWSYEGWKRPHFNPILAFRVIAPYREPEEEPCEWAFSPDHHVIWYDSETNMVRIKEAKK